MENEYFARVTDIGKRKMLEAVNIGEKINIVEFAVGDGGGSFCTPSTDAIKLENEVWRGKVDSCHISEESENVLLVETVMPSNVGGFTVREMGIFDQEGDLIAICNVPDTQKVRITDGVVHELNLIMEIALDNVEGVELVVDPCVLMATKKDVANLNEKLNKYLGNPDNINEGIGLDAEIQADNVIDAINKVFQIGNEKKNKLVENLVAVGIEASTNDTWEELLDKVLVLGELGDIYTAFVAAGVTPSAKTSAALAAAVTTLKNNSYNSGYAAAGFKGVVGDSGNYVWTGQNEGVKDYHYTVPSKGNYMVMELIGGGQLSWQHTYTLSLNGANRNPTTSYVGDSGIDYLIWVLECNAGDQIYCYMSNKTTGNGATKALRAIVIAL